MSTPAAVIETMHLAELLAGTTAADAAQREAAEQQLTALQEVMGFAPALLQIVHKEPPEVTTPTRLSAAVYLKKLVVSSWCDLETEPSEQAPFALPECDRAIVRDALVEATVRAPELVREQLCTCVKHIIQRDFPERWSSIVDEILPHLQDKNTSICYGASLCLYQLIKCEQLNTKDKRAPFIEAMRHLLPAMQQLMERQMPDKSEQAALLKKQLVENFYWLMHALFPELISKEKFAQYMEILLRLLDAPIPPQTLEVDANERSRLPWWKSKEWAVRTLSHLFERYGSPKSVREEYIEFAEWYLTTFTGDILEILFKVLDRHRAGEYVSPGVLEYTLCYIDLCLSHAHSWKLLKPHMFGIVQDILFPLMSYSLEDENLYKTNIVEYISTKINNVNSFNPLLIAGENLLRNCCKKRKDMLQQTMQLYMQVLTAQNGEYGPQQRDGAFHMVGTLAKILKKKLYKKQMKGFLTNYVFPEFNNPLGYLRARACWVLYFFIQEEDQCVLMEAARLTINTLLTDTDLSVKFQAATTLDKMLRFSQQVVQKYVEKQTTFITLELLNIIRKTKDNDELTEALRNILHLYTSQLMPIVVEICEDLASTLTGVMDSDDRSDEEEEVMSLEAFEISSTIETVITVMMDQKEISAELEKIVLRVVEHIFLQAASVNYKGAASLMCKLSFSRVTDDMWKMLELLYQVFEKNDLKYFEYMMPVLYNYVTVDTNAFVSNENHILIIFNMCKKVLNSDVETGAEIHAAKLLEVMVLQCNGRIDQYLPAIVELVLSRLARKFKTNKPRTMALQQVIMAILYSNPVLMFNIIESLQESLPNTSIAQTFIKQWIDDVDCFLGIHDRKMCILGLCTLLEMGPARPLVLDQVIGKIVPSCLILFHGLKREYEVRAEALRRSTSEPLTVKERGGGEEEGEEEGEESEDRVLSSDDDENLRRDDCSRDQFLHNFARMEELDKYYEEHDTYIKMEDYTTPVDKEYDVNEYVCFKDALRGLAATEPELYNALTGNLNSSQQNDLQEVFLLADKRSD